MAMFYQWNSEYANPIKLARQILWEIFVLPSVGRKLLGKVDFSIGVSFASVSSQCSHLIGR